MSLFWLVTLPLCFAAQIVLSRPMSIYSVFPDFLQLIVIYFALVSGPVSGAWLGWIVGFLADATSSTLFGSQMFMFCWMGFWAGRMQGKVDEEKPLAQMTLVAPLAFLSQLGVLGFEAFFDGVNRWQAATFLGQVAYTAIASPLVFFVLSKWCLLWRVRKTSSLPEAFGD